MHQLPAPANQDTVKDYYVIPQYQVPDHRMQQNLKEKSNHLKKAFCQILIQLNYKNFS